jgi:hypothetical protein
MGTILIIGMSFLIKEILWLQLIKLN